MVLGLHPALQKHIKDISRRRKAMSEQVERKKMKTIWKYELEATNQQELDLPLNAKILTMQMQNDKPCLWALVDEKEPRVGQPIFICVTGQSIEFVGDYLGTYQLNDGALVFHVFTGAI